MLLALRCRVLSCVSVASGDTSLMSLPLRPKVSSCVSIASGDTSLMLLAARCRSLSCVSVASGDTSLMSLPLRLRYLSCMSVASGDRSLMLLSTRLSPFRLCACSSPVRSVIPRLRTSSRVRFSIVCVVREPISCRTAAAKFASGIDTTLGEGSSRDTSIGNTCLVMFPCTSMAARITSLSFGFTTVVTNSTVLLEVPLNPL